MSPLVGFYVSAMDGTRRALLLGPLATHEEALEKVEEVRERAEQLDARAAFAAFGTARVEVEEGPLPKGKMNGHTRESKMRQVPSFSYEGTRRWSANPEDDRCGDGSIRATASLGPGDTSERHRIGAEYDSRCPHCWANDSHTTATHQRSIKAYRNPLAFVGTEVEALAPLTLSRDQVLLILRLAVPIRHHFPDLVPSWAPPDIGLPMALSDGKQDFEFNEAAVARGLQLLGRPEHAELRKRIGNFVVGPGTRLSRLSAWRFVQLCIFGEVKYQGEGVAP